MTSRPPQRAVSRSTHAYEPLGFGGSSRWSPAPMSIVSVPTWGSASASITAARRVHAPAASAQIPSPVTASGRSSVVVTENVVPSGTTPSWAAPWSHVAPRAHPRASKVARHGARPCRSVSTSTGSVLPSPVRMPAPSPSNDPSNDVGTASTSPPPVVAQSAPTITESFGPTTTAGPPQPPSRMLLAALNCPIGGPDSPVATIDGLAFPRIVVWVSEPPLARIAGPALSTNVTLVAMTLPSVSTAAPGVPELLSTMETRSRIVFELNGSQLEQKIAVPSPTPTAFERNVEEVTIGALLRRPCIQIAAPCCWAKLPSKDVRSTTSVLEDTWIAPPWPPLATLSEKALS